VTPLGELPLAPGDDGQQAIIRLQELQATGVHLRTRALTTTLFSRICLADLFVHGIGGAKYDEITDNLISEFFGLPIPAYWTVSGTLQLPLGKQQAIAQDLHRSQRKLWDLQWNPTRALADIDRPDVQRRRQEFDRILSQRVSDLSARRKRHAELTRVKAELRGWTNERLPAARAEIAEVSRQLAANRILQDREYSYVLYPADKLHGFLTSEPI
jgi:hypothetical protein